MTAAPVSRPQRVIDAHHHIWDLSHDLPWLKEERIPFRYGDYSSICKNYMPEDYRADTKGWNVTGSVYIEAEWNRAKAADEPLWVAEQSAKSGVPSVMIAWADFGAPEAEALLASHAKVSIVRGVRHKPTAAAKPSEAVRGAKNSMDDPNWRRGYAFLADHGLHFDVQTPWWHLDALADLARDFPHIPVVINHTALPADRSPEALGAWRRALEAAAALPNITLKISGIGLPGQPWTVEANGPIIRDAIAIFGVDRAMFASNFPVDGLTGSFDTIWSGFLTATADFTAQERDRLFHDNAVRIYRMSEV